MSDLARQGDRRMTVREVAGLLGVTDEAIKKHIRELSSQDNFGCIGTVQGSHGGKPLYVLTEAQVTEIKRKMIPTTQVVGAITDLEAAEMLLKSAEHFKTRFEQERQLRIETENKLAIAEPKAEVLDRITATESDISVRELAAILAIPRLGQNNMFERLRKDGYIDGFNRPYRQYIESGIMYEKEYYVPQLEETKRQLRITQKGVAYFARKYGAKAAV
jgi:phage antirepressor YoqD-like protein